MIEPKTWTDKEIIDLMLQTIKDYKLFQISSQKPIDYTEMMEEVLEVLDENGLIEHTP